jgi:hypothetical protein
MSNAPTRATSPQTRSRSRPIASLPTDMPRTLVLQLKKGGLGDHLFYSHVPRAAKESKTFDAVLISNQSHFRHPDYKRLVWELNPFVDGFTDEAGVFPEDENIMLQPGENLPDRLMLLLGIDDGKRFHEPEIFYKPTLKPELRDATIYDPNFVSWVGGLRPEDVEYFFRKKKIRIDFQMKPRDGGADARFNLSYTSLALSEPVAILETPTLEDFCNIIASCKKMFCLTTGTATLAAALGKHAVVLFGQSHDPLYRHSKLLDYVLVGAKPLQLHEKILNRLRPLFSGAKKNGEASA